MAVKYELGMSIRPDQIVFGGKVYSLNYYEVEDGLPEGLTWEQIRILDQKIKVIAKPVEPSPIPSFSDYTREELDVLFEKKKVGDY